MDNENIKEINEKEFAKTAAKLKIDKMKRQDQVK